MMPQGRFMDKLRQFPGVSLLSISAVYRASMSNETNGECAFSSHFSSRSNNQRCAGSVTVNVDPTSGALSTRRSPPIPRTSSRLIANPSPVPWCTRVRLVST